MLPLALRLLEAKGTLGTMVVTNVSSMESKWKRRLPFPKCIVQSVRTNQSVQTSDTPHHRLQKLEMILCFPIDYIHAVCLGVMRSLASLWLKAPCERSFHLAKENTERLDNLLEFKQGPWCCDIKRKWRRTDQVRFWKATEYRPFLLYAEPASLPYLLKVKYYNHLVDLPLAG